MGGRAVVWSGGLAIATWLAGALAADSALARQEIIPAGQGVAVARQGVAPARTRWTLAALVAEAKARSPAIAVKAAAVAAAGPRVSLGATWPDPMFTTGIRNMGLLPSVGLEPMSQVQLGISQTIPFPGKTRLRSEAAEAGLARARADLERTRRDVVRQVKEAWFDLYEVQRSLEINAETRTLLARAAEVASARYRTGKAGQMDVLRAEVEAARMQDERAMLEARQQALQGTLASLVGLPPLGTDFGQVATPDLEVPDLQPAELAARILQDAPGLEAAKAEVRQAEKMLELARMDVLPDLTLMGGLMNRGALPGGWEVSASVDLPLFYPRKQRKMVDEAAAMADEARRDREKMLADMLAMARDDLAMARSAAARVELLRNTLIPRARLALQAGLAGYGVGMEDFLSLTMAIMAIQDLQREQAAQLVAGNKALARLEALVGETLAGGVK